MNRFRSRRFQLNDDEIPQILAADDSADESDMELDEEDQAFLECDADNETEIIIEGQNLPENSFETDADIIEEPIPKRSKKMSKCQENDFKWVKKYKVSEKHEVEYPYGKVKLLFDGTKPIEPTEIFEKTCSFNKLLRDIVEQSATERYPILY